MHVSIEDLARVSLPNRGERGIMAMLEAYFDDSGTHGRSPVIAWGGIAGDKGFLDNLDRKWRAQLEAPCEGKPPVKAFHSYDLENGIGEFAGYNRGASDLTRANFRRIIVESGVTPLAYGVSVKDWNQVVGILHQREGSAEEFVFGLTVYQIAKAARLHGDAISLQFDKGQDSEKLRRMIEPAVENSGLSEMYFSYGFLPVGRTPALQAADLVAHEAFRFFNGFQKEGRSVRVNPHTTRLINDSFYSAFAWMGRVQIKRSLEKMDRAQKKAGRLLRQ